MGLLLGDVVGDGNERPVVELCHAVRRGIGIRYQALYVQGRVLLKRRLIAMPLVGATPCWSQPRPACCRKNPGEASCREQAPPNASVRP